jgi:hypothetical protein
MAAAGMPKTVATIGATLIADAGLTEVLDCTCASPLHRLSARDARGIDAPIPPSRGVARPGGDAPA